MLYFLTKYVWIQNRNTKQTVKWQPWPYLVDLLAIFAVFLEIVILKARQLGISWLVAGYCLWQALFHQNAKALFFSQGEEEAWEILDKARFIWENLPDFLQLQTDSDTRGLLTFGVNRSELKALPSTAKAGRGTDASVIVRDEVAQHPYGRENFTAIGAAVDSGGQLIDLGTINKLDLENHLTERVHKIYHDSERIDYPSGLVLFKHKSSQIVLIFLGWRLRPVRQEGMTLEEWFDLKVRPKYSDFEIEQEYPETIEKALREIESRPFFNLDAMESLLVHIQPPLQIEDINTFGGIVKVYKLPQVGEKYCVFTDPSDGVDDPFHTVVIHARTYEGVCEASGKVKADVVAKIHDSLVRYYNNAFNTWEINATAGGKMAETIANLETPNQAPRIDAEGKQVKDKTKLGWFTGERSKRTMLYGLEEAVRQRLIITHEKETVNQFKAMALIDGVPQVPRGVHDDRIMAWAGAWQLRKYVPMGDVKIQSFSYRD